MERPNRTVENPSRNFVVIGPKTKTEADLMTKPHPKKLMKVVSNYLLTGNGNQRQNRKSKDPS